MIRALGLPLLSCLLVAQQPPHLTLRDDPTRREQEDARWNLSRLPPEQRAALQARVAREFQRRTERARPGREAAGADTWRCLGPTVNNALTTLQGGKWKGMVNDSGRVQSILVHPGDPRTVYLSTAGGGVWKATDADPAATTPWNWQPLTDGLPAVLGRGSISTGLLAMAQDEPERLHLAMGDWNMSGSNAPNLLGTPLYVSRNGGRDWEASALPTGVRVDRIKGLATLPGSGVLAVIGSTPDDRLFASTDGGRTFSARPMPTGYRAMGVRVDLLLLADKTLLLADGGSIFRSTDAGVTWTRCATDAALQEYPAVLPGMYAQGRMTLAASASSASIVYGIYRWQDTANSNNFAPGVLKSTDGGLTWSFLKAPKGQQWNVSAYDMQATYNHLLTVDPSNPEVVFCAGQTGIHRSQDGGRSWTQMAEWPAPYCHPDNHAAAWASGSKKVLYVGHDGGLSAFLDPNLPAPPNVQTHPDAYVTPSYLNHAPSLGLMNHEAYGLACTDAETPADAKARILLYMQDNGVSWRLGSGNALWTSSAFGRVCGGDGMAALLHPLNGDRAVVSAQGNWITWTADGFKTGSKRATGIPDWPTDGYSPFFTVLSQGGEPDGNTIYAIKSEAVYRSQDFGATFTKLPAPPREGSYAAYATLAASPFESATLLVLVSGTQKSGDQYAKDRAFLTRNAGGAWVDITPADFPLNSKVNFHFDPKDREVIYASFASGWGRSLLKTSDGGRSWTALDGSPAVGSAADNGFPCGLPCWDLKVDPTDSRRLMAATEIGIYRSQDGGSTWQPYGQGMPMVRVTKLFLSKDGRYARAATFGRGVWEMGTPPEPPAFQITPRPTFLWEGEPVTFTASTRGVPDPSATWTLTNGTQTSSATGPTIQVLPLLGTLTLKGASSLHAVAPDEVIAAVRSRDQDRDGKATVLDMAALSLAYGKTAKDPDWKEHQYADLNGDGRVDDVDVDLLLQGLK